MPKSAARRDKKKSKREELGVTTNTNNSGVRQQDLVGAYLI
jgi:hypothetical protein